MFYNVFYILEKKKPIFKRIDTPWFFFRVGKVSGQSHEMVDEHKGRCERIATQFPFTPALGW